MTLRRWTLRLLPRPLAVYKRPPDSPWPATATGAFVSVTRTPDELSVTCDVVDVPPGVEVSAPWRALGIAGPLDFSMLGVLADLARTLAEASVSVLAVSTHDTDWLLVREGDLERAVAALERDGHRVELSGGA